MHKFHKYISDTLVSGKTKHSSVISENSEICLSFDETM